MSDIVERLRATGYTVIDARNKVRYRQTLAVCEKAANEIDRLRSQIAEQEATIRRLQDRASKDAETFSSLKREAVESEREACAKVALLLGRMDWEDGDVGPEGDGYELACEEVYYAILARSRHASSPTLPNTQPACANGGDSKPEVTE